MEKCVNYLVYLLAGMIAVSLCITGSLWLYLFGNPWWISLTMLGAFVGCLAVVRSAWDLMYKMGL